MHWIQRGKVPYVHRCSACFNRHCALKSALWTKRTMCAQSLRADNSLPLRADNSWPLRRGHFALTIHDERGYRHRKRLYTPRPASNVSNRGVHVPSASEASCIRSLDAVGQKGGESLKQLSVRPGR
eukprot:6175751-Pleurochrysis_carterae.AAC.1